MGNKIQPNVGDEVILKKYHITGVVTERYTEGGGGHEVYVYTVKTAHMMLHGIASQEMEYKVKNEYVRRKLRESKTKEA